MKITGVDTERHIEILMAIYRTDMEKISNKMQEVKEYSMLAELYDESAKLIRKLDKEIKGLEDGNK